MNRQWKTRLAALLSAAALLAAVVGPASAASEPTIAADSQTITQGGTCTLTVSGENLSALTSLKLTIAYDADVFTVLETSTASMDVATANSSQAGIIEYIGISMDGISGENTLLTISFCVASNATPGEYPVTLFVGGATAAGESGDEYVTLATRAGSLTVEQGGTVSFYTRLDNYAIESGDEVTMTVSSYSTGQLAGGRFVFLYDSTLLEYKEGSLQLLSPMTGSEYTHTVNSANAGRVSVAYAATEQVRTGNLMQITFVAKENVSGSAQITFSPESLTDINAAPLSAYSTSTSVTISEKSRVWLEVQEEANTHEPFTVGFWVEGASNLAAGDFSVSYDTSALECLSVESTGAAEGAGYLVINDAFQDGSIEFSVLCPSGIQKDTQLLEITFRTKCAVEQTVELTPAADTTPVNPSGVAIQLACPVETATVLEPDHLCENGFCYDCNQDYATVAVLEDTAVVCIPNVAEAAQVIVAFYDDNDRMIDCRILSATGVEHLVLGLAGASDVVAYVVDSDWCPLRNALRSN